MISLPSAALPFLLQQRTEYGKLAPEEVEGAFSKAVAEFADTLKPYLPPFRNGMRFVDIGCGLGFSLLGLRTIYGPAHWFVGVDKGRVSDEIAYGFSEKPSAYNSLSLTMDVLVASGIGRGDIELVDLDRQPFPSGAADIVTSTLAWGFHFPVATYLDQVNRLLEPHGTLVIDVRRGFGQEIELLEHYDLAHRHVGVKSDRLVLRKR